MLWTPVDDILELVSVELGEKDDLGAGLKWGRRIGRRGGCQDFRKTLGKVGGEIGDPSCNRSKLLICLMKILAVCDARYVIELIYSAYRRIYAPICAYNRQQKRKKKLTSWIARALPVAHVLI